jgi:hypothetical protein
VEAPPVARSTVSALPPSSAGVGVGSGAPVVDGSVVIGTFEAAVEVFVPSSAVVV